MATSFATELREGYLQVAGFLRPEELALLARDLILMLQRFRPEPPTIDEDEIRQQLILEALRAVVRVRLLEDGRRTKVRLFSRTYTRMLRWLGREGRRQRRQ